MGETNAIAHNTVVSVQLPNTNTTSSQATAFISSDNSQPRMISDTLDFSAGSAFSVTFDRNSPVNMTSRTDSGQGDFATNQVSGITFSDDRNMRVILGDWPGGFNRHGILTLTALVHTSTATQAVAATQSVAFNCSSLSATGNTFTAQSNGQAAGVTISSFVFTVKDANGNTVDTQTVTTNAQNAVYNFNQSNPGTYTVNAVINSDKGSTAASACSRQITVASQSSTLSASTTNNQPAQVPNTGAGDILSVFAGASSVGAIGHYVLYRRR
jgi:hypothetical protein